MYRYITHDYTRIHQFTIVSHSMTSSKLIVVPVTSSIWNWSALLPTQSPTKSKLFVKMKSSYLSEVDQLLSEVNVKLCEANVKLSKSFEVKSKRKLLPRVQMILSELEWIVDMSDEEDVSVSSCESLSWDSFNERKWEMSETWELGDHNNSDVSSLASISSSPSDVEEEESLEDVFQTITPTNPTRT